MEAISIQPPLQGEWKLKRPPGHHPHACDFVKMDGSRKSYHRSAKSRFLLHHIPASSFFCWDQPVYAPISGKVIRVGEGWPDNQHVNLWKMIQLWYNATYKFRPQEVNGRLDIRPNAGNYVMIQAEEGYIVFLAHLKEQSIAVSEGATVSQGELVGRVGNSGNSGMPHLHINLFDQMDDPYKANVLPFVLSRFELSSGNERWEAQQSSLPAAEAFLRLTI